MTSPPPAVVLLSGGLDSATVLAIARARGFAPHALSVRYGQRHVHELAAAEAVARRAGVVRHVVADVDLRQFGGSALTDDIAMPNGRAVAAIAEETIPVTYVPARNTVFLGHVTVSHDVSVSAHVCHSKRDHVGGQWGVSRDRHREVEAAGSVQFLQYFVEVHGRHLPRDRQARLRLRGHVRRAMRRARRGFRTRR